jgi:hypothetical protein
VTAFTRKRRNVLTEQQRVTVGTTLVTALLTSKSRKLVTPHRPSSLSMSSATLISRAKEAVIDFAKSLPGGVAELSDFEDWGKKFVVRWVRFESPFLISCIIQPFPTQLE